MCFVENEKNIHWVKHTFSVSLYIVLSAALFYVWFHYFGNILKILFLVAKWKNHKGISVFLQTKETLNSPESV
jgi:hypothetical protein